MAEGLLFFYLIQVFILLLGISLGHSILLLKIRHEENRKKELELALLEKREDILQQGKKIAHDLEEVLYKAKVQQEIDDIIRKNGNP
jgi:predicted alpha/beta-fold hydrolase